MEDILFPELPPTPARVDAHSLPPAPSGQEARVPRLLCRCLKDPAGPKSPRPQRLCQRVAGIRHQTVRPRLLGPEAQGPRGGALNCPTTCISRSPPRSGTERQPRGLAQVSVSGPRQTPRRLVALQYRAQHPPSGRLRRWSGPSPLPRAPARNLRGGALGRLYIPAYSAPGRGHRSGPAPEDKATRGHCVSFFGRAPYQVGLSAALRVWGHPPPSVALGPTGVHGRLF